MRLMLEEAFLAVIKMVTVFPFAATLSSAIQVALSAEALTAFHQATPRQFP
jgi:hypothetical protein